MSKCVKRSRFCTYPASLNSTATELQFRADGEVVSVNRKYRGDVRFRHGWPKPYKTAWLLIPSSLEDLPVVQAFTFLMMFSKLSVVLASVLIAVAAARPSGYGSAPPPVTPPTSNQCCTSVLSSTDSAVSAVAGVLGLDLSGLNVPVGLGCSPITVIGNNCGSTTVTCDAPEKEWGSLIAINCLPITL